MSDLQDGFSKRNQGRGRPQRPGYVNQPAKPSGPKPPPSKDRRPAGWDKDIWHLTLLFEQYARADGIELKAGRPVIYMEIDDLVSRYKMRPEAFRQEVYGCGRRKLPADMAARCWYHWPPDKPAEQVARELDWVQKAEIIMAEFWSRIQNDMALDHLRQFWAEYGSACLEHWRSLRIIKSIDEQPRKPREIMRRRKPGDTMQADSKEG